MLFPEALKPCVGVAVKIRAYLARIITFMAIVLVLMPISAVADTQINVPVVTQEHSNWCWAASTTAVLSYYGRSKQQCEVASKGNWYFNGDEQMCCGNSTYNWNGGFYDCNNGRSLSTSSSILYTSGVSGGTSGTYLPQTEVVNAINLKQPFIMSWEWTSGGGHEMVGYGYDQNGLYLDYMDPLPGHGYTKSLYSWVVNASDHRWHNTRTTVAIGVPTNVSATAGNTNAAVSFTAPAENSTGSVITYTATSNPGNITAAGTSTPIIVPGLTNGASYTFTVTAANSIRTSPPSLASNTITPLTAPEAPVGVSALAGLGQATVSFSAPVWNGGSPITSYTVTSNPDNRWATGTTSPITVTGLTGGAAYTFKVTATNAAGVGPASSPSNSVIPTYTVPNAPTGVYVSPGNAMATVSFWSPNFNGGSPITSYTVTSNPGNIPATGIASPIAVTGLTNGTAYTFTVKATNAAGTGPASSSSSSITPYTVPGIPTGISASAGIAQATVSFTAPSSNGGSPITSYTVVSSPGNIPATGTASPITVSGLSGGTAYTFTVTAINAAGAGPISSASNNVTPAHNVPDAPYGVSATAMYGGVAISFSPPYSNGGKTITSYTVKSNPGNITATGTASPIIMSLTPGTAYSFTVTATNAAGTGPASYPSNSITPMPPLYPVPALSLWSLLIGVVGLGMLARKQKLRVTRG